MRNICAFLVVEPLIGFPVYNKVEGEKVIVVILQMYCR